MCASLITLFDVVARINVTGIALAVMNCVFILVKSSAANGSRDLSKALIGATDYNKVYYRVYHKNASLRNSQGYPVNDRI